MEWCGVISVCQQNSTRVRDGTARPFLIFHDITTITSKMLECYTAMLYLHTKRPMLIKHRGTNTLSTSFHKLFYDRQPQTPAASFQKAQPQPQLRFHCKMHWANHFPASCCRVDVSEIMCKSLVLWRGDTFRHRINSDIHRHTTSKGLFKITSSADFFCKLPLDIFGHTQSIAM